MAVLNDASGNPLTDAQGNALPGITPQQIQAAQTASNAGAGGVFSGLASMIGGQLLGPTLTNPNYQNAVNNLQGAQNTLAATPVPTTAQMQLVVQNYVNQGILTPTQAQAVMQDPNALNSIMTNPDLTNAQMQSLGQLQNIAANGGLSPQMQAQMAAIQGQQGATEAGANAATMQQAQMRGMGGAGTTLLGQLTNNQGAASNAYQQGLGVASLGQQNALNALTQGAGLANTMQQNSFNQQAQQAAATNAINQFNAQNSQNVNLTNAAAQNAAANTNLTNANNAANASTTAQNAASAYNATLPQQQFNDMLGVNTAAASAAKNTAAAQQNVGNAQTTSAGNATNSLGGLFGNPNTSGSLSNAAGSAINNGLSSAGDTLSGWGSDAASAIGDMFSDKNLKEDIKPGSFDIQKFLDSVSPQSYNYKPKAQALGMPSTPQTGVMAQDLEKTPAGRNLVENTPDGKMVDYSKAGPTMLAAIADLHKRTKALEGKK
jgi:hypothetical protein